MTDNNIVIVAFNARGVGTNSQLTDIKRWAFENNQTNVKVLSPVFTSAKSFILNAITSLIHFILGEIAVFWFGVLGRRRILVFADYSLCPWTNKIVICRQPSIVSSGYGVKGWFQRLIFRLTAFTSSKVIAQNQDMSSRLESFINNKKVVCIPNFIPSYFVRERKMETVRTPVGIRRIINFYYPSGFYPHKRFDLLIEIFNRSIDKFNEAGFKVYLNLFVSEEDYYTMNAESARFIVNHGPMEKLYFLKFVRDNMDVMLFPSEAETFGNGIAEAAVLCKPSLIQNAPYSRAIVINNQILCNYSELDADSFYNKVLMCESPKLNFDILDEGQWLDQILKEF